MICTTVVADAHDNPLTLNRVVSLLRGRCFTVLSFTAARSHQPGVVRLTIVIDAGRSRPGRVAACLSKLADVWNVRELDPTAALMREVVLVRVLCASHEQPALMDAASRGTLVIHRDAASLVLAVADEPEQLDRMLQQFGARVIELVRSGPIAMTV